MVGHAQLDVQVAGRSAAGADLAVRGQVDPVAGADPRRDLHVDGPGGSHPAVSGALRARVGDDRAVAAAGRAGLGGPDVADERPLDVGHVALAVAGRAADRLRALGRAGAVAAGAEHGGVHPQRLGGAERRLGQLQVQPDQGVLTAADPRPWATRGLLAEHRVDQVGEVEPAGGPEAAVEAAHPAAERVAAPVVEVPLLGVLQHLVRLGDLLEALGGIRLGGHVGVQLHRQPAVGLLDLLGARVARYPEDLVVVTAHRFCDHPSDKKRPT